MNFVSTVDKHLAGSPLIDAMATPSLIRHINQTRVLRLLEKRRGPFQGLNLRDSESDAIHFNLCYRRVNGDESGY